MLPQRTFDECLTLLPFPVLELNGEMSRRWLACKTAFSRCKKLQDQATAFVSKCKTSTTGLKEQYKQLVVDEEISRLDKAEASAPDEIPHVILCLRLDEYNRVGRSPESVLN